MAKINVSLPDGSKREFEAGISLLDIAKSLNQKLGKTASRSTAFPSSFQSRTRKPSKRFVPPFRLPTRRGRAS